MDVQTTFSVTWYLLESANRRLIILSAFSEEPAFCGEGKNFKGEFLPKTKTFELVEEGQDVGHDRYSFYLGLAKNINCPRYSKVWAEERQKEKIPL